MTALELARHYLKSFIGEYSIDEIQSVLSNDLIFEGPFLRCSSASDYIKSLINDPIKDAKIMIIDEFEHENGACIIYELVKPEVSIPVAQWFKTSNGQIVEIRVFFDSGKFK